VLLLAEVCTVSFFGEGGTTSPNPAGALPAPESLGTKLPPAVTTESTCIRMLTGLRAGGWGTFAHNTCTGAASSVGWASSRLGLQHAFADQLQTS